ncbi:MAG: hypothetical protein HYY37_02100 [Candidatus Aenigmarchaeota archaeon]|nr:hypothetical protein [Candidatus Aenigmarchaeota archaeon]
MKCPERLPKLLRYLKPRSVAVESPTPDRCLLPTFRNGTWAYELHMGDFPVDEGVIHDYLNRRSLSALEANVRALSGDEPEDVVRFGIAFSQTLDYETRCPMELRYELGYGPENLFFVEHPRTSSFVEALFASMGSSYAEPKKPVDLIYLNMVNGWGLRGLKYEDMVRRSIEMTDAQYRQTDFVPSGIMLTDTAREFVEEREDFLKVGLMATSPDICIVGMAHTKEERTSDFLIPQETLYRRLKRSGVHVTSIPLSEADNM